MRQEKFETLFDFGTLAYNNGYYREAVADFATALERFLEFFIRTVLRERSLPDAVADETWKLMSQQSERQLGAFAVIYLYNTGRVPEFLKPEYLEAKFRNNVVHKGKIPSQQETSSYAETVYGFIRDRLHELWEIAPSAVGKLRHDHISTLLGQAEDEGYATSIFAYDGMFGVGRFNPVIVADVDEIVEPSPESSEPLQPEVSRDYLRTDAGFEDTLKSRMLFVKASFYDEQRDGSEGELS